MPADLKRKIALFMRGWGFSIFVAVLMATSFKSAIADWNVVPSGSMKPTIVEGDRIFVNKLAYDLKVPYTTWRLATWGHPQRGDIVVFYSPEDGKRLVKRVIGLPGDIIAMRKNRLFINGQTAEYGPLDQEVLDPMSSRERKSSLFFSENLGEMTHAVMMTPSRPFAKSFGPIVIPPDHFFMLGDNRDASADSRFFGFVNRNLIVGRATAIVISLNYNHYHLPRWDRSFQALL